VELGRVRCIVKDRAKSAARPRSCLHQLVFRAKVVHGTIFFLELLLNFLSQGRTVARK
jgi:hypothetical protein